MGNAKEADEITETFPEDWLLQALRAETAERRLAYAHAGLALADDAIDPDTHLLLLRQVYLAQITMNDLESARQTAERMVAIGTLRDLAYHDWSRILFATERPEEAIFAQRLAARTAPASRRSFHLWGLATLLHFAGQPRTALDTLGRAERWAQRDLPLLRAHGALIRLELGEPVAGLDAILSDLRSSPSREGYGEYLLGSIAAAIGDERGAIVYLRAFLHRNASADPTKALTLREELRRARSVVARFDAA